MIKTIAAAMVCVGLVTSPPLPKTQKQPELIDMGEFEITFYAEDNITATGTQPQPMRTCAVDPTVIPYGSTVYIDDLDLCLVAEDCGGAVKGEVIDVFIGGTEEDTYKWGRQHHNVWIKKEVNPVKKQYLLLTSDGDRWVYDTYDEAARTAYIFGGAIIEQTVRTCPICGKEYTEHTEHPIISRKDNTTEICPACGVNEAFEDLFGTQNKEEKK